MEFEEIIRVFFKEYEKRIRDSAIVDFVDKLKEKYGCLGYIEEISFREVDDIVKQMKEEEE